MMMVSIAYDGVQKLPGSAKEVDYVLAQPERVKCEAAVLFWGQIYMAAQE